MKPTFSLLVLSISLLITSCSTQLTHIYEGDVQLSTIEVTIDPLPEVSRMDEESKTEATIRKIQKIAQEIEEVMNPSARSQLFAQLQRFEDILVDGIRQEASIPLVAPSTAEISLNYNEEGELEGILFEYEVQEGATLDIDATISYSVDSSLYLGVGAGQHAEQDVYPRMGMHIGGYTDDNKTFWSHWLAYESPTTYKISNQYVLGVALNRLEDGDIFLIPLAEGIIERLPGTL